jgi:hypothetical protein
MRTLTRIFSWIYTQSLRLYPHDFCIEFGEEMNLIFLTATEETKRKGIINLLKFFAREIRDLPASIWREHLRSRKGFSMDQNSLAWRPLNTKELLMGLTLFIVPILGDLAKLGLGYGIGNRVGSYSLIASLVFILVILIIGFINGFPRWTVPYLGVTVITIVMLQAVFPLWGLFVDDVRRMTNYFTKTLAARIQYSVLLGSFFWLVSFVVLALLILFLMAWPRTRKLAQCIRQDWTLMSFMVYSALVFNLELVFEEYAYDEVWKIACRVCLALGAWIYFKNADQRKRILALLAGATLFFGIAAVGQWVVLPQQTWGAFYDYDHWTYRRVILSGTLTGWVSALFFMMVPALINLIPRPRQAVPIPEETPA